MKQLRHSVVIAVSGPDGAGKSTLVADLQLALRDRGFAVATAYCYGCLLCRRFSAPRQLRTPGIGRDHRSPVAGIGSWPVRAHGLVDCAELALRLAWARLAARTRARGRPTAVVTDRGPLDGLAKFDPAPRSWTASLLVRLAAGYDATLLLDATPQVLASRDGEHPAGALSAMRARYLHWGSRLPSVIPLDAGAGSAAVAAVALGHVLGDERSAASRKHVVISIFDDLDNPHYGGGGAILVEKVARRLSQEFDVTVVTAARRRGTSTRDGVRYRYLPVGWAGPRAGQLLFHALLPLTARRLPHDLWLESFTPPFSTSFLPLFSRAPVVGIAQSRIGEDMWRKYRLPFFVIERLGLRVYRDLVVLNRAHAAEVRRRSPNAAVHVVPNGVEPRKIDHDRLGQGDHILFLGRIDVDQKGLDLLLDAYAKAAPPLPLLLAGTGTRAEERKLAALLNRAAHGVRWLGHVSGASKRDLLERTAFAVMPSRHEAFGISALEAMSYGKPVLHFDLPTLRWLHGAGNVAVTPFDVDALAGRMRSLASDGRSRERLARVAHRAALHYTWDETTGRYLSLARHLLSTAAPGVEPGMARRTEGGAPWVRTR